MRLILFISRVALLCNALFIVCMTIRMTHDFIHNQDIKNYIIILGWFVSPVLNLVANISWMAASVLKKKITIPGWILLTNLMFFIAQIFIYFIFPL